MKKLIVFAGLFVFVFLNAANYSPSGTDVRIANITNRYEAMDPMEGIFPETEKIEELIDVEEITDREMPAIYAPLWADDLLVTDQCNIALRYNIAFDYDANGYLYAGIQSSHSTGGTDSLFIFQSTDKGYTWNEVYSVWAGSGGKLLDFEMRLQPQVTVDPAIYIAWVDSTYASGNRFYFGAIHPGGTQYWHSFTTADPVIEVAMDVSTDAVPFIVLGYITQESATETGWYTTVTADTGVTWTNYGPHSTTSGPEEVTVACLDDGHFYGGAIYTQLSNRFRMFEYDGGWGFHYVSGTNDVIRHDPCLATQKYHAYPSNYVYGIYSEGSGTAFRVYFNYSSDAAQNWGTPDFWGPVGDVQARRPYIRNGWDLTPDRICGNCVLPVTGDDSLVIAMIGSDFQTWSSRVVVNDHNVTGSMPAQSIPTLFYGGRVIIYRQYGSDNIWFDRWNYTSNVEEETPNTNIETGVFNVSSNNDGVRIDFSVVNDENIKIEVYDFSGRSVNTLLDTRSSSGEHQIIWDLDDNFGQEIQAGTYFINLNSDSRNITKKVTIL